MGWEKPAPALVARFDASLPADALVERRQMFGCPCAFVNGNMFAGLHEQNLILRLPETRRGELLAAARARPFTVMGSTMREYVALGDALGAPPADVAALVAEAYAHARTLPPKTPKRAGGGKAPKSKRRGA